MKLVTLCAVAVLSAEPKPTLVMEKLQTVDDPRIYDLRDPITGDRGAPMSCSLSNNVVVTLGLAKGSSTLQVAREGNTKTIVVENTRGLARSTLACGPGDDFYYANPRLGQLYAYSATRVLRGEDPVVWTRRVEPFKSLDDVGGVMTEASIATALQVRQKLVLLEWFFRSNGTTGFWHEVFDAASGAELAKIGPSDLLLKLNERDAWWIAFQGGGNETANYVPQGIYRLRYGPVAEGAASAAGTVEALRKLPPAPSRSPSITLSKNPVINHMIALLSPTRTSRSTAVEFCPATPAQRARYWMGPGYDELLANVARDILLAVWAERQAGGAAVSPVDSWFQTEIAPKEPMKTLLAAFNPQDDAWVSSYQRSLQDLAGPTLESWFATHGAAAGVVRTKTPGDAR